MPAARLAVVAMVAALAGCTVEATGFRVTLRTHGAAIDRIDVTVLAGAESRIGSGDYTGDIADGATFGVRLPDSLEGTVATVSVVASRNGAEVGRGSGGANVVRHQAVEVTVDLKTNDADMTVDGGDLAGADLSRPPDLTTPPDGPALDGSTDGGPPPNDLAGEDLAPPADLAVDMMAPCVASCANNVAVVCENGVARQINCSFGCSGAQCTGPNSCMSPGVINQSGTYHATTAGALATANGSCNPAVGPDNTLSYFAAFWTKAVLSLDASFPGTLFARRACADPASEWVAGGLCVPGAFNAACVAADPKASLTLCGLPPGEKAFVFVEHAGGAGGTYALTATYTPLSVNTCAEAGMLPGNAFNIQGLDTSAGQQDRNSAPLGAMNCGDRGVGSPEMVFWVPITAANAGKTLTITVTSQGVLQPLLYIQTSCMSASTVCYQPQNGVAKAIFQSVSKDVGYYIFVDGLNGTKGKFNLDMTLKP